jgi:hypothetical protein
MPNRAFTNAMRAVVHALRAHHATRYMAYCIEFPNAEVIYTYNDRQTAWLRYAIKCVHNWVERNPELSLSTHAISNQMRDTDVDVFDDRGHHARTMH